jgi:hypothetical protein
MGVLDVIPSLERWEREDSLEDRSHVATVPPEKYRINLEPASIPDAQLHLPVAEILQTGQTGAKNGFQLLPVISRHTEIEFEIVFNLLQVSTAHVSVAHSSLDVTLT